MPPLISNPCLTCVCGERCAPCDSMSIERRPQASVSLIEQVKVAPTGTANYGVSRQGDLLYVPASATTASAPARSLASVDRKGVGERRLPTAPVLRRRPHLSRRRTCRLDVRDQTNDIWIWDVARQTLAAIVIRDRTLSPLWTPDSKRIVWTSTRGGGNPNLFWQAADGTGTAERAGTDRPTSFPPRLRRTGEGSRGSASARARKLRPTSRLLTFRRPARGATRNPTC